MFELWDIVSVVFEDSSWAIVDPPFGVSSKSGGMIYRTLWFDAKQVKDTLYFC